MAKPKIEIEYTPEMDAALDELAVMMSRLPEVARKAGCKSMKIKVVRGKGGISEVEYRREWDKNAPPYDVAVAVEKPKAPLLARPTV